MLNITYYLYAGIFIIGLYGLIASNNLLRKLISLNIIQTATILLYVALGYKSGNFATPIYAHAENLPKHYEAKHDKFVERYLAESKGLDDLGKERKLEDLKRSERIRQGRATGYDLEVGSEDERIYKEIAQEAIHRNEKYINPVPHVLMLTAIVVGISVTSIALALLLKIKDKFGTIEADDLNKIIKQED